MSTPITARMGNYDSSTLLLSVNTSAVTHTLDAVAAATRRQLRADLESVRESFVGSKVYEQWRSLEEQFRLAKAHADELAAKAADSDAMLAEIRRVLAEGGNPEAIEAEMRQVQVDATIWRTRATVLAGLCSDARQAAATALDQDIRAKVAEAATAGAVAQSAALDAIAASVAPTLESLKAAQAQQEEAVALSKDLTPFLALPVV